MKKPLIKMVAFGIVGALLGYAYYYFIGCRTGSCPLSSNPYIMTGYGFFTGVIVGWDKRIWQKPREE